MAKKPFHKDLILDIAKHAMTGILANPAICAQIDTIAKIDKTDFDEILTDKAIDLAITLHRKIKGA